MPKFQAGEKHPRFRDARTVNENGYKRVWAGEYRGWYEHRMVVDRLLRQWRGRRLQSDEEVHHIDFRHGHNCPQNLLLLPEVLHHAITPNYKRSRWMDADGVVRRGRDGRRSPPVPGPRR